LRVRVLLDTNVWLAILTTDGQCRRMWRSARNSSQIYASPDVLGEIEEKLRLKFGFHPRHAHLLAAFVRRQTKPVSVAGVPPKICRDADDDFILAAAIKADCDYLVTGDKDLLVLKKISGLNIASPREFAEVVSAI
jgi:putative PIN family toxin of toxin-antitoxin system